MVAEISRKEGKYLYAIAPGDNDRNYGPVGINGSGVYTISDGQVAAVVSDIPNKNIRPERRNLAAHHAVLKRLLDETTVLPTSFGIIAADADSVLKILSRNQKAFLKQLKRLAGKVEMGLRITWDVPNIFEYFVLTHPHLRVARDRFIGGSREPTQEDKIELGRMFERILNDDREASTDKVEKILQTQFIEVKRNQTRTEREVVNLACLVDRGSLSQFETAVLEAAKLFDNNFAFEYNGPWAPHNFVEMDIDI